MRPIAAALALALPAAALAGDPPSAVERFDRPPTVTADFKDEPLEKALAEACRQAGCRPIEIVGRTGKVTLEAKDLPFWTAVDRILEAGARDLMGWEFAGEGGGEFAMNPLKAVKRAEGLLRAAPCDGGPVRVALVAVAAERSGRAVQRFAPGAEEAEKPKTSVRVGLRFQALDGLDEAEGTVLRVDTLADEKGRKYKVLPEEPEGGHARGGISGERWIRLEGDPAGAEKIAELSGALVVRIAKGESAVDLDLEKLPASAVVGGTTLTVLETGDGSLKIEVKGSLFPPESGAEATLPDIVFLEEGKAHGVFDRPKADSVRLVAVDAAGKPVGNTGWSGSGGGGTMTYECSMEGTAAKLTVKAAKSLERREVPFRFADIPLPR